MDVARFMERENPLIVSFAVAIDVARFMEGGNP